MLPSHSSSSAAGVADNVVILGACDGRHVRFRITARSRSEPGVHAPTRRGTGCSARRRIAFLPDLLAALRRGLRHAEGLRLSTRRAAARGAAASPARARSARCPAPAVAGGGGAAALRDRRDAVPPPADLPPGAGAHRGRRDRGSGAHRRRRHVRRPDARARHVPARLHRRFPRPAATVRALGPAGARAHRRRGRGRHPAAHAAATGARGGPRAARAYGAHEPCLRNPRDRGGRPDLLRAAAARAGRCRARARRRRDGRSRPPLAP